MYLNTIGIILCVKVEQRVNVKFLAKLGKSAIENHGFFQYDPETKCQSIHLKIPTSPRKKKHRRASPI
jgi:hypothetical protein